MTTVETKHLEDTDIPVRHSSHLSTCIVQVGHLKSGTTTHGPEQVWFARWPINMGSGRPASRSGVGNACMHEYCTLLLVPVQFDISYYNGIFRCSGCLMLTAHGSGNSAVWLWSGLKSAKCERSDLYFLSSKI